MYEWGQERPLCHQVTAKTPENEVCYGRSMPTALGTRCS